MPITSEADIVTARRQGRELAMTLGFTPANATLVATAISELARNIVLYAKRGEIVVAPTDGHSAEGLMVTAWDVGDGIPDIALALQEGFSTGGGLGVGLSAVKRVMDEFEIVSEIGKGTTVIVKKWKAESRDEQRSDGGPRGSKTG